MEIYKDEDWLRQKYLKEKLSANEISLIANCPTFVIRYWLKKHKIKVRSLAEAFEERQKLYGYKRTPTTRQKISDNHADMSGANNPMFGRTGHLAPGFGRVLSAEERAAISTRNKGRRMPQTTGDKNHNWKGGITPVLTNIRLCHQGVAWRNFVFARDNHTCQLCFDNKGGNLNAHHIIELASIIHDNNISSLEEAYLFPLLWDVDNGLTLCKTCHKTTHRTRRK